MSIQIEVPFDALSRPGVARALADLMVSLGGHSDLIGGTAAAPAAAPAPAPAPAAPAAKPAKAKRKGKAQAKPKAKGRKGRKPKAAPAPSPGPDAPYGDRWAAYIANLPPASARFLELLEEKEQLTVSEAVKILGLKTPKAMGGLTGAMRRWAPKQHISLPFEAQKTADNERCWVWTGHPE